MKDRSGKEERQDEEEEERHSSSSNRRKTTRATETVKQNGTKRGQEKGQV